MSESSAAPQSFEDFSKRTEARHVGLWYDVESQQEKRRIKVDSSLFYCSASSSTCRKSCIRWRHALAVRNNLINMLRLIKQGEEHEEEAMQPSQVIGAQLQQKHHTVGRHLLGTVGRER